MLCSRGILQRHLARVLYEVQAGLARHLEHADDLGRYIAGNCWVGSDRFQQLTEQPLLLGQIALALLRPTLVGEETILRGTLERVATDLRQERQAAAWLSSARRTVEESVVGRVAVRSSPIRSMRLRSGWFPPLVLPRLNGSYPNDEDSSWSVRLRSPHLAPLLDVSPDIRAQVAGSRASIPAAPSSRLATGQLLFPNQEIELERRPLPGEPLLKFEGLSEGLETALLSYWAMTPGPWLFLIKSNLERVRHPFTPRSFGAVVSCGAERGGRDVACAVRAFPRQRSLRRRPSYPAVLHVPDHVGMDLAEALKQLRVVPARELTLWPAGVLPAEWDGDERSVAVGSTRIDRSEVSITRSRISP